MKTLTFFLLLLLIPVSSALEFYPSSLTIELKPNEQTCLNVFFELDNPATIKDEWATNPTIPWSVSYFDKTADYHEIQITYPSEVSTNDTQAEFCISGSKRGEYRGALVFRQQREGNSIVQFVIWLKLTITGETETPTPQQNQTNNTSNSGSSSNFRSSSFSGRTDISGQTSNFPQNTQPLAFNPPQQPEEITLESPTFSENNNKILVILSIMTTLLVAVFLIILLAAKKPKKKRRIIL